MAGKKKKKRGLGPVRTLILIAAMGVFGYSAYQLYSIYNVYHKSGEEYRELSETFTKPYISPGNSHESITESASSSAVESVAEEVSDGRHYEDAQPPLEVDFAQLNAVNPDVVAWIHVEGLPEISYPVCQGSDNDYYLHHTFRGEYLYAGSIFEDYHNSMYFSDPNTIVYGHNMKNGSMFNHLKKLKDQAKYDENPYFWVITPKGSYRYHIFSVMTVPVDSDVYLLYSSSGDDFLNWEKTFQAKSEVKNDVELLKDDKAVILSTCTSDSNYRDVVIGKCVSSARPDDFLKEKYYNADITEEYGWDDGTVYDGDVVFGEVEE